MNMKYIALVVIYLSARTASCQDEQIERTCTELKSDTLDVQCQRGFRKVSCDGRILPGTKGNLACKPGYQLHKDPDFTQVTCGDDGIWDNCLFSCEPECGNPTPIAAVFETEPPVSYLAGQYPWFAMIYIGIEEVFNGTYMYRCAATIINQRMVITVAHCIYRPTVKLEEFRVTVGSSVYRYNRSEDIYAQNFEVEKILTPKIYEFDHEARPNDIGIVLIKGKFTFDQIIKPICLDRNFNGAVDELPLGTEGLITGFVTDRQVFREVRFVYNLTLPSIAASSCKSFDSVFRRFYQSQDKFCAGNLSFGYIPFGFVGGGYVLPEYTDFDPVYYLRGIAAVQGRTVTFLGMTDVHIHLPWILQQEKQYLTDDIEKPPEFCGLKSQSNASLSLDTAGSCRLPTMPSNGRYFVGGVSSPPIVGSQVPEWSVLKYKCKGGYALRGTDTSFCNGGIWSNNPRCLRMCEPLIHVSLDIYCSFKNEEVPCESPMPAGTIADINCRKGYRLDHAPDNTRITCGDDGTWNASPFKCTPECGLKTPKGHSLVIGGTFVKTADFPWHAGIYEVNATNNKFNKQICGGSIINAKMVLSAAHCFYPTGGNAPYEKSRFAVAVGKIYRKWVDHRDAFAKTSDVEKLIIPSSYDDVIGNYAQDIAIVVLTDTLSFSSYVRPICIQWTFRGVEEELKPGTPGIVSGWGLTSEGGVPSAELKAITLPSVPRYACRENFPSDFRPFLTHDKFCAGYQNGSSVCKGDSGGGLSFPQDVGDKTSVYYLRGVVSVGPTKDGTCDSKQYTVFTSVLANIEWLKKHRAHISV